MHIQEDDPERDDVVQLIAEHLQFSIDSSPPGHCFVFDCDALKSPEVSFWTARDGGELLGMIALQQIEDGHGEIKSVHTVSRARGRGIGSRLLAHVIASARARGLKRLSLETGDNHAYAPSRILYKSLGFKPCPVFAGYVEGFSYCMTRLI